MNKPPVDEILCEADHGALPVNVESGGWSQGELLRMDEQFCAAMQRDYGFPLDSPSSSFAVPFRHVFGAAVFDVIERVDMPRPGDRHAGHFQVRVHDPAWHFAHGPLARSVARAAQWLSRLQFLTIRSYLALVFAVLIVPLLVVAPWR